MKKQNLLALAVVMTLAAGTFGGCGSGGSSSSAPSSSTPSSSASSSQSSSSQAESSAAEEDTERYHYTIVQHLTEEVPEDAPMIQYWGEMFNADFTIETVEQSKINELMSLRFASGDIPDVITNLGYSVFYDLVNQGIAGTWSEEFMREHAPDIAAYLDELGDDAWKAAKHENGELFTTPGINPSYMYGNAIIWRDSWMEAVGEEIPRTLEDAERVWYKFANNDPDGNGAKDTYGLSKDGMNQVYGAYGVPLDTWIMGEDGKLVYSSVAPKMKEALTTLARYYADGVLDPEFITGQNKGDYIHLDHAFCQGRIGFTNKATYGHWYSPEYLTYPGVQKPSVNLELFLQNNPGETFSYGWPLEGPDGDKYSGITNYAYWSCYSKAMTDDEGKFGRFLKIFQKTNGFTDPTDYLTTRMGIQGTHWDYNEYGQAKMFEGVDQTAIGAGNCFIFGNNHHTQEATNPNMERLRLSIYSDPDRYAMWTNYILAPLPSSGDYEAECQKLIDEGFISIITGEKPVDYFDEIVKQWYAIGGQTLTDEANATL